MTIYTSDEGISVCGSSTEQKDYSVVTIKNGATVKAPYGIYLYNSTGMNCGYGAVLDISGTVTGLETSDSLYYDGTKYGTVGIFVSGNMNANTGNYLPRIIIREGAKIGGYTGASSDKGNADAQAIAGNGYAKVTIYGGELFGDEALGIKSGEWEIHGGTFTATGTYHVPHESDPSGSEMTGAAVSITTTYTGPISVTIHGGTFSSQNGSALYCGNNSDNGANNGADKPANVQLLKIIGGRFTGKAENGGALVITEKTIKSDGQRTIIGGMYSSTPAAYLSTGYTTTQSGSYWIIAKAVPAPQATVKKDETGAVKEIDASSAVGTSIIAPTDQADVETITLELSANNVRTGDIITLAASDGEKLAVTTAGVITGKIAAATVKLADVELATGGKVTLSLITSDIDKLFGGYTLHITNEPAVEDRPSGDYVVGFSVNTDLPITSAPVILDVNAGSKTPQVWHADEGVHSLVPSSYTGGKISFTASSLSSYYVTLISPSSYTSSSGNMDGALRVLFNTQGGSSVTPATGLSYGSVLVKPADPTKSGATFAGWYKDSACTNARSFSDGINGDMELYAKWVTGSSPAQPTAVATTARAEPPRP